MHVRSHHNPRGRAWVAGIRNVQIVILLFGYDGDRSVFDPADSIHVLLDPKVDLQLVNKKTSNPHLMSFYFDLACL